MKQFVAKWLAGLARQLIAKYHPQIIGITGSVGKTSTRDAIYAVVSTAFSARKGTKNLNNEFGLPLAIIGSDSPGRNLFGWFGVFLKAYWQLWFGSFPKILVLEMGVDRPNDMDYLLSIARPNIAVITNIGISHYEFFGSQAAVAQEKGKLVSATPSSGAVILNSDNVGANGMREQANAKVIGYGFNPASEVRIQIKSEHFQVPAQSELEVHTPTQNFSAQVPAIGIPHLASCGAAVAVGLYLGLPIEKIQAGLKKYKPVPGRLNLLTGIKRTLVIDDSYNASPDSMREALEILRRMPYHDKVAVLGDMLELGEQSQASHEEIGSMVAGLGFSQLITVGSGGQIIANAARAAGMPADQIHSFATSALAAEHVRDKLIPESAVLVKGSQGVRMEKISKELLADPMSASNVLPRQYGKWLES